MKKLVSILFVCAVVLSGCGGSKSEDENKALIVLTNAGYPPYEMVDEKGELYGFDIDVMNRAAEIAGFEIEWKDMDFDAIPESLRQGKGDVAIAGMTPSPEREEKVDFSVMYYTSEDMKNVVLTKKDSNLKTTADLKGTNVGVQMGTVQEMVVSDMEKDYELTFKKLKGYADLVQELNKGVIDAMIVEKAVAIDLMEKNTDLEYYVLEEGAELAGNAMAFKKESELKADFDKAIKEMIDSGEMDELIQKWFNE